MDSAARSSINRPHTRPWYPCPPHARSPLQVLGAHPRLMQAILRASHALPDALSSALGKGPAPHPHLDSSGAAGSSSASGVGAGREDDRASSFGGDAHGEDESVLAERQAIDAVVHAEGGRWRRGQRVLKPLQTEALVGLGPAA